MLRYCARHEKERNAASFSSSLIAISVVMLLLVADNLSQVAIWALLFGVLGEFQDFSAVFYHSAVFGLWRYRHAQTEQAAGSTTGDQRGTDD